MTLKFAKFYFVMQGIGSLIAWQGILTGLSFFQNYYPNGEVDFTFPLAQLIPLPIIGVVSIYLERIWHINVRIAWFTGIMGIATVFLPIIAIWVPGTTLGLWLSYSCCFLIGVFNAVQQSSIIGLAGYFHGDCMAMFSTGFGIAGLIENALRAICLVVFPSNEEGNERGILVYYTITGLILVFCILLHYKFVSTEYVRTQIMTHKEGVIVDDSELGSPVLKGRKVDMQNLTENLSPNSRKKIKDDIIIFWDTLKQIKWFAILIAIEYIQTLMLFPGVTLMVTFANMNANWENVVMVSIFNFFDTIGRYLGKFRQAYNETFVVIVLIIRFAFFYTFIIQVTNPSTSFFGDEWFSFLNIALFGLTNGFSNSTLFILGPEKVSGFNKEVAGFIMITFLNLGIVGGSLLSLTLENI